jgi:hypothetical protein
MLRGKKTPSGKDFRLDASFHQVLDIHQKVKIQILLIGAGSLKEAVLIFMEY